MPSTKQRYNLATRHQLIDLNKEYVNFKLDFQVFCADPQKEFEALVVEQSQLDANLDIKTLEMKRAKGKIGGNIVADKNRSQNYFLVLKGLSEEPTEVEVAINLEEIQPNVSEPFTPPEAQTQTQTPTVQPEEPVKKPFYKQTWFILLLVGVILGGLLYYYLFFVRKPISAVSATPATIASEPHDVQSKPSLPSDAGLYPKLRAIS
jgi:hypothetical protein